MTSGFNVVLARSPVRSTNERFWVVGWFYLLSLINELDSIYRCCGDLCTNVRICSVFLFILPNFLGFGCLGNASWQGETDEDPHVGRHQPCSARLLRLSINSSQPYCIEVTRECVCVCLWDQCHIALLWQWKAVIHRSMWARSCMQHCSLQASTREAADCSGVVLTVLGRGRRLWCNSPEPEPLWREYFPFWFPPCSDKGYKQLLRPLSNTTTTSFRDARLMQLLVYMTCRAWTLNKQHLCQGLGNFLFFIHTYLSLRGTFLMINVEVSTYHMSNTDAGVVLIHFSVSDSLLGVWRVKTCAYLNKILTVFETPVDQMSYQHLSLWAKIKQAAFICC